MGTLEPQVEPLSIGGGEPWSDRMRADIVAAEPSARGAWTELLRLGALARGKARPTQKWRRAAREQLEALGHDAASEALTRWLLLVPEVPEATADHQDYRTDPGERALRASYRRLEGEDGDVLKLLMWLAAEVPSAALAQALAAAATAAYLKAPGLGQRCGRAGNAAVGALERIGVAGAEGSEGIVSDLATLRDALSGYGKARGLVERALGAIAEARGTSAVALIASAQQSAGRGDKRALAAALERAEQALAGDDLAATHRALVDAWREERAVALAEAVTLAARRLRSSQDDVPGKRKAERIESWKAIAAEKNIDDLERLLEHVDGKNQRVTNDQLLLLLDGFAPHPRLAEELTQLIVHPLHWVGIDRELFRGVVSCAEPRSLERLRSAQAGYERHFRHPDTKRRMSDLLEEAIASLHSRLPDGAPTLAAAQHGRVSALAAALRGEGQTTDAASRERDVLAAIAAAPDDDAPRRVYADLLNERGDPRGELIELQLLERPTAAQRERERELLTAHAHGWLGPLAPLLRRGGLVYERGFPVSARLAAKGLGVVHGVVGDPRWGTFRAIDVRSPGAAPAELFTHPIMGGLRELLGISTEVAVALAEHASALSLTTLGVTTLTLGGESQQRRVRAAFARCRGLPELTTLRLRQGGPGVCDWLIDSPAGKRLRRLELELKPPDVDYGPTPAHVLAAGVAVLFALRRRPPEVTFHGQWRLDFSRAADKRAALAVRWAGVHFRVRDDVPNLARLLRAIPSYALSTLDVKLPREVAKDGPQVEALRASLSHFDALVEARVR